MWGGSVLDEVSTMVPIPPRSVEISFHDVRPSPRTRVVGSIGPNDPRVPFCVFGFRRLCGTCRWTAVKKKEGRRQL